MSTEKKFENVLFVGNLGKKTELKELDELFTEVDGDKCISIQRHSTSRDSLGFCYIKYPSKEEAAKAVEKYNGMKLNGRTLRVEIYSSQKKNLRNRPKICVKELHLEVTEKEIKEIFSKYGEILSIDIRKYKKRAMAIVEYPSLEEAEKAVNEGIDLILNENKITVEMFEFRGRKIPVIDENNFKNLFVGNITNVDESVLSEHFSKFGNVVKVQIPKSHPDSKESRGFAFVEMETHDEAIEAMTNLTGKVFEFVKDGKVLNVSRAFTKDDRFRRGGGGGGRNFRGGRIRGRGRFRSRGRFRGGGRGGFRRNNFGGRNMYYNNKRHDMYGNNLMNNMNVNAMNMNNNLSHQMLQQNQFYSQRIYLNNQMNEVINQVQPNLNMGIMQQQQQQVQQQQNQKVLPQKVQQDNDLNLNVQQQQLQQPQIMVLQQEKTNIIIQNLDERVSKSDIAGLCGRYGKVLSSHVMVDNEGNSRGFGFVNFESSKSASDAIYSLHNKVLPGTKKNLIVKFYQPKEQRQKYLKNVYKDRFINKSQTDM